MDRPRLTLREAADATGAGFSTLRRKRTEGVFPGATKDDKRGWLIPVDDLLAAGYRLHAPAPPDPPAESAPTVQASAAPDVEQLRAELAAAKTEAVAARTEARVLRELLAAKDDHVTDLRRQVLMLTAGPTEPPVYVPPQPSGSPTDGEPGQPSEHPRLRWWQRPSARHRRS